MMRLEDVCGCNLAGTCRICQLVATRADYATLFGRTIDPAAQQVLPRPVAKDPEPCTYLGDDLTGQERDQAGLDHSRRWSLCTHPTQPLGQHVCPCKGCGVRCPGYPPPELEQ